MIQRIQSIYLFIAAVVTSTIYAIPYAEYIKEDSFYILNVIGLENPATSEILFNAYPLLLLTTICLFLSLAIIFLYKNRILQARLCNLNILLYVFLIAGIFLYSDMAEQAIGPEGLITTFKFGSIVPIIAIILV
jgi:glucan phosphoethanolaminetransferase (alkaline phosphatase superfamily)